MAWYYVSGGASNGPVAEADIQTLHAQKVVAQDTPVWTDGMAEWLPFSSSALAAQLNATHACTACRQFFSEDGMINYEGKWVCAACKPVFFQQIKEGVTPPRTFAYAPVMTRFGALVVDGVILVMGFFILSMPISHWAMHSGHYAPGTGWPSIVMLVMLFGLPPVYEILMIGKYGATWGKMAMEIKVVSFDGGSISYVRSTGRYFAKIASSIFLYIGFLMAFWDKERRALHDQICRTLVIKVKPS